MRGFLIDYGIYISGPVASNLCSKTHDKCLQEVRGGIPHQCLPPTLLCLGSKAVESDDHGPEPWKLRAQRDTPAI